MVMINFILNETVKQLKRVPVTSALIVLYAILGANLPFDQNIVTQNNTSQQGVPQSYQNIVSSKIHTLGKSVYSQVHFILAMQARCSYTEFLINRFSGHFPLGYKELHIMMQNLIFWKASRAALQSIMVIITLSMVFIVT